MLSSEDKILRNQTICDLMNNGFLQFSQEAVDDVVKNVDTKDKLIDFFNQAKSLIESYSVRKVAQSSSSLLVKKVKDTQSPIFNINKNYYDIYPNMDGYNTGKVFLDDAIKVYLDDVKTKQTTFWPTTWDKNEKIRVKLEDQKAGLDNLANIIDSWNKVFSDHLKYDENVKNEHGKSYSKSLYDEKYFDKVFGVNEEKIIDNKASSFKEEFNKAAIRVLCKQSNKAIQKILLSAIPPEKSKIANEFLNSELGESFLLLLNGAILSSLAQENKMSFDIAKELRVNGLSSAINVSISELTEIIFSSLNNDCELRKIMISNSDILNESDEYELKLNYI